MELMAWAQPTLPSSQAWKTPGSSGPRVPQCHSPRGSQRAVPAPAVAASPACFLEMQILRHHPKPIESEPLGVRPESCFHKPSK